MRRRAFIAGLGGAAVLPFAARAQEPVRRLGFLMNFPPGDPEGEARVASFRRELQQLGWSEDKNLHINVKWSTDAASFQQNAADIVAAAPDVLVASASAALMALQRTGHRIPTVFVLVADPIGGGFVSSLARPGGHITGFTQFEYGISTKWLELLRTLAPSVRRVLVFRDPNIAAGSGQLGGLQAVAPSMGIELRPVGVAQEAEMAQAIRSWGTSPDGGLIVTGGGSARHRALIISLAAEHRIPAVYPYRYFVSAGGLASYGPDPRDQYRQAAGYVHRILKGESPAELPIQAPTRFETVVNLKTANALGLTVPATLLGRADEVIE